MLAKRPSDPVAGAIKKELDQYASAWSLKVADLVQGAVEATASDPDKAAELRAELMEELSDWEGPDGVESPSAVWIVTARRPA